MDQLGQHLLLGVEFFFSVYKQLEGKETAIWGWEPVEAARAAIAEKHRPASGPVG